VIANDSSKSVQWPCTLEVTLGAGLDNHRGRRETVKITAPSDLVRFLQKLPVEEDAWWAGTLWRDDYANTENWEAASCLMVDIDVKQLEQHNGSKPKAKKRRPSDKLAERFEEAVTNLPVQAYHRTHHGWRLLAILPEAVTDPDLFEAAGNGLSQFVEASLKDLGLPVPTLEKVGILVDHISGERFRMMRRPRCVVPQNKERPRYTLEAELCILPNRLLHAKDFVQLAKVEMKADDTASWPPLLDLGRRKLPEFPCDALPPVLASYVHDVANATQTPAGLAGMLALAVLAAVLSKKVRVKRALSHQESVNLFVVVSMPPGERKSPVFKLLTEPLEKYERELRESGRALLASQKAERDIDEKRLAQLKKVASNTCNEDAEEARTEARKLEERLALNPLPELPRLLADDATPEKVATLLNQNDGRLAVFSTEGGPFELMSGRYSNNGSSNFDVFLKGWSGDTLRVDRSGGRCEIIEDPRLTVALTIQPSVLRDLGKKKGFRGRGLLGRFLYASPASRCGFRKVDPASVSFPIQKRYTELVTRLLKWSHGDGKVRVLCLTVEARALWKTYAEKIERLLRPDAGLEDFADWANKIPGTVLRIAGLLHVGREAAAENEAVAGDIGGTVMSDAIKLGEYLLPHAQDALEAAGESEKASDAKYLVKKLKAWPSVSLTARELLQKVKGRIGSMDRLRRALEVLEDNVHIRLAVNEQRGPGRPTETFDIHPDLHPQNPQKESDEAARMGFEDFEDGVAK
jgi:replicative DNA helicase